MRFSTQQRGDDGASGFGLGAQYHINDQWQAGLVFRRAPKFKYTASIVPGTQTFTRLDKQAYLDTPDLLGLGLVYRPSDALTLALDVSHVQYSQLTDDMVSNFNLNDDTAAGRAAIDPLLTKDDYEVRLGMEYTFTEMEVPLSLRAGVWRDPEHTIRFNGVPNDEPAMMPSPMPCCSRTATTSCTRRSDSAGHSRSSSSTLPSTRPSATRLSRSPACCASDRSSPARCTTTPRTCAASSFLAHAAEEGAEARRVETGVQRDRWLRGACTADLLLGAAAMRCGIRDLDLGQGMRGRRAQQMQVRERLALDAGQRSRDDIAIASAQPLLQRVLQRRRHRGGSRSGRCGRTRLRFRRHQRRRWRGRGGRLYGRRGGYTGGIRRGCGRCCRRWFAWRSERQLRAAVAARGIGHALELGQLRDHRRRRRITEPAHRAGTVVLFVGGKPEVVVRHIRRETLAVELHPHFRRRIAGERFLHRRLDRAPVLLLGGFLTARIGLVVRPRDGRREQRSGDQYGKTALRDRHGARTPFHPAPRTRPNSGFPSSPSPSPAHCCVHRRDA
ncbi:MAG: outer membrane protein transport protein [Xanthomonadales bacterium]|nr:outer membrane protein transport protein [Xanthomonadales bacterium]